MRDKRLQNVRGTCTTSAQLRGWVRGGLTRWLNVPCLYKPRTGTGHINGSGGDSDFTRLSGRRTNTVRLSYIVWRRAPGFPYRVRVTPENDSIRLCFGRASHHSVTDAVLVFQRFMTDGTGADLFLILRFARTAEIPSAKH